MLTFLLYISNRILQSVLVLFVVSMITFSLFNFIGDPINNLVSQYATQAQREQVREELGLNDSTLVQYVRYVKNVFHGQFGISYRLREKVSTILARRLPATIELVLVSAILAISLGLLFGLITAVKPDAFLSKFILVFSLIGVSLPTFLIGIGLIYFFAVYLHLLPAMGRNGVLTLECIPRIV